MYENDNNKYYDIVKCHSCNKMIWVGHTKKVYGKYFCEISSSCRSDGYLYEQSQRKKESLNEVDVAHSLGINPGVFSKLKRNQYDKNIFTDDYETFKVQISNNRNEHNFKLYKELENTSKFMYIIDERDGEYDDVEYYSTYVYSDL